MAKNKTPDVPQLSGEERALLEKQGVTLDQFNSILSSENVNAQQNQALLKGISGLYNPDGTINQEALSSLRQRTLAQQTQQEALGQQGLNYLQGVFGSSELDNVSGQAGLEEANQYLRALQGTEPLSAALSQQEADRFKKLTESAGQRGIRITGNDLFTATSDSTAGNQLLSQLRKEAQFNRETQRENALNRLQSANMARLGFGLQNRGQLADIASGTQYAPGQASLGYLGSAQQMGPGSLLGSYQGLASSYGQAAQPYQQQRYLQYQGQLQNSSNRNGLTNSLIGAGAQLGTGALFALNPGLGFGALALKGAVSPTSAGGGPNPAVMSA